MSEQMQQTWDITPNEMEEIYAEQEVSSRPEWEALSDDDKRHLVRLHACLYATQREVLTLRAEPSPIQPRDMEER